MHYNLTQVVPGAFLSLPDGTEHVQVLHLVQPKASPGRRALRLPDYVRTPQ